MSEYSVKLLNHVHANFAAVSTSDFYLEFDTTLPFPPFRGLGLYIGEAELVVIGNDAEIVWKDGVFFVYAAEDKTLYNEALHRKTGLIFGRDNTARLRAIVQEYLDSGWQLKTEDRERFEKLPMEVPR